MSNTWLMRHRPFRFHLSVSVSVSHSLDSLTHSLRAGSSPTLYALLHRLHSL